MRSSTQLGTAAALGGVIIWVLALGAQSAAASTIYACVNKHGGSARIVGAKTKCRRGERKLSWSAVGPSGAPGTDGAPGAPGAAGTDGANGAGVDYGIAALGPVPLAESGSIVVARTIPAGSYFVNAKSIIAAGKAKTAVLVAVICEIVDTAGTPSVVEPPAALDFGEWFQALVNTGSEFVGVTTMALQAQLTTTQPTTLALACAPLEGGKESRVEAVEGQLSALQTTANR